MHERPKRSLPQGRYAEGPGSRKSRNDKSQPMFSRGGEECPEQTFFFHSAAAAFHLPLDKDPVASRTQGVTQPGPGETNPETKKANLSTFTSSIEERDPFSSPDPFSHTWLLPATPPLGVWVGCGRAQVHLLLRLQSRSPVPSQCRIALLAGQKHPSLCSTLPPMAAPTETPSFPSCIVQ